MDEDDALVDHIVGEASKCPDGATKYNLFCETVYCSIIPGFADLAKRLNGKAPRDKDISSIVVDIAKGIHLSNPQLITKVQYKLYVNAVRKDVEMAVHMRRVYDKVASMKK